MAIQYSCKNRQRKSRIRDGVAGLNGIDYLEVSAKSQSTLYVYFIRDLDKEVINSIGVENIRIEGGSRITGIRAIKVGGGRANLNVLRVELDRYGDFSQYTLRVVSGVGDITPPDWLDPILSSVEFSFKVACPRDFDCQTESNCSTKPLPDPEIDYLAKDFSSFRQLMLDRLANVIPEWKERNPSDLGMAIVEVLAYAGDHLSYYQDAVATEAYLDTARRRVSVRRHARLLDYHMHEGCNARTWVVLDADDVSDGYQVREHTPLFTEGTRPVATEVDYTPKSVAEPIYNTDLSNFVLLAEEFIELGEAARVTGGSIGVNRAWVDRTRRSRRKNRARRSYERLNSIEIKDKAKVRGDDSVVFGDLIQVGELAQLVHVAYKSGLDNKGKIGGNEYDNIAFPVVTDFPVFPTIKAGETDVKVESHKKIVLDKGEYADLKVEHNGTVIFKGGTYSFRSVNAAKHAKLIFMADTELRVERKINVEEKVRINSDEDNGGEEYSLEIFFSGRTHSRRYPEIVFGESSHVNANVYAPTTFIKFEKQTHAEGLFYGRKIVVGERSMFKMNEKHSTGDTAVDLRFDIPNLASGMNIFETMYPVNIYKHYNQIEFYTWGDDDCCLPKGATRASLNNEGNRLENLSPGDVLLFEERIGPGGHPADANKEHRHVVRLTNVMATKDPLYDEAEPYFENAEKHTAMRVLDIEWALEDALPFPLCLSSEVSSNKEGEEGFGSVSIGVARGNIVLADEGRTICREPLVPEAAPEDGRRYQPTLSRSNPTFSESYDYQRAKEVPAAGLLEQDPRTCVPHIFLDAGNNETWTPQRDLLNTDRFATEFVMEVESDGRAQLRFGDNVLGKKPTPKLKFSSTYRVGNGSAGNIGLETLSGIILPAKDSDMESHITVCNPMAARGGIEPESIDQVKLYAPQAFRTQKRAVTPEDYAQMAEGHSEVQKAVASQRWTGSWHTVFITIDRVGGRDVDADFEKEIRDYLEPFRMMGHELEVEAPRPVSLDIAFRVCVQREFLKSKVKESLLELFSSGELSDGSKGLLHPDNFTFGQSVYLSRFISEAMQVAGVTWVDPLRFKRLGDADTDIKTVEELQMGRLEIARLDNDPNAPENGRIEFVMEGGL